MTKLETKHVIWFMKSFMIENILSSLSLLSLSLSITLHFFYLPSPLADRVGRISESQWGRKWPSLQPHRQHFRPNGAHKKIPVVNFINILLVNFPYEGLFGNLFYLHVSREKLPKRRLYKRFERKMLMKLTPVKEREKERERKKGATDREKDVESGWE